jgi:hypothetical protein
MKVRCNKCQHVGDESEFPKGRDFFQNRYVSGCPQCDNRQSPGDASMRMMPGVEHPFTYVRPELGASDAFTKTMHNASEAS